MNGTSLAGLYIFILIFMFKLNFIIAFRNIWKNKSSSLINIGGLAIGLSSCLLLMLYAHYEWNYDKQFKNSAGIYQAMVNSYDGNGNTVSTIDLTANVLAATLKEDFPEVKHIARTTNAYKRLLTTADNSFKISSRYADPDFLKVFDFQFLSGNPAKALNDPNSIILTATTAKRLFGTTDVLNKTVKFENQASLKVTAVIKDLPANITYTFEALTPWTLFENLNQWPAKTNWGNHSFYTLMTLTGNTDINQFNQKLKGLVKNHIVTAKEDVFLFPLTKLHLYGDFVNGKSTGGKISQVQLFVALALGILLIACINFMNLSTAHAQKRAKEVAIKKTMGATKSSLVFQFLAESLMLTAISILISIAIVELALPWFNHLLDITITISYLNPVNWIMLFGLLTLTGFLAGSYPAFYLSAFNPVQTLKKKAGFQILGLRQILVIIQFSFAIILIASTVTIYQQIQFIKNRPLGYQPNGLVEVPHEGLLYEKYDLLKSRLLESQAVVGVTQSSSGITNKESTIRELGWEGMAESGKLIDFDQLYTTADFVKTTGIRLTQGRDFNKDRTSDHSGILLSEKAVRIMGLKHPLGAKIIHQGEPRIVTGVFADIVWGNPNKFTAPMLIAYADGISETITMRLNPQKSAAESIAAIGTILKELNPDFPVDIKFIDNLNQGKLKNEATIGILANIFGGLAIFISCMGLFGLTAYSAAQRTKEIGIRKILGATVKELMEMLALNFVKLVLIAIVISSPVAWYLMNRWLMNFDIQTPVSLWIFILTALFTILISLLTVSWQTYKAAIANPIKALKYE
ncbi:FtsX-like permease family protein [Pedobacter cryoconitis]|uniref:FtsX-like permease family protein n=2 Tax=Pedobacter cryoconitis TaxID=188932 RepID=A0A327SQ88_9SPHI|nr:FtsX-like permease family protein [Pedobacter cryoconitis]